MPMLWILLLIFCLPAFAASPDVNDVSLSGGVAKGWMLYTEHTTTQVLIAPAKALIGISAQASSESIVFGPRWTAELQLRLTDDHSRDWRLDLIDPGTEQIREANEIQKIPGRWTTAMFSTAPLPVGAYHFTASWRGRTIKDNFVVMRGDETPEIEDFAIQERLATVRDADEQKRLLLRRLEINPSSIGVLSELGELAETHGTLNEAVGYYKEAIALCMKSDFPPTRERGVQLTKLIELLPAYFADREHLKIEKFDAWEPRPVFRPRLVPRSVPPQNWSEKP
jgi:hypothetical protein